MDPYLRRAREAIELAAGRLPVEVIGRAVPGGWSVGEILEHLTLAFRVNAGGLRKVLDAGTPRGRRPTTRQALSRMLVIDLGYFPRVKAPDVTVPSRSIPPDESVPAILEALDSVDRALAETAARFGARTPVANHPYFAGLTPNQWRKFHWRHTLHHMRQVRGRAGT